MATVLKILQSLLGLVFAYYIYRGLMGRMKEHEWTIAFAVLMAVFILAYIKSQLAIG